MKNLCLLFLSFPLFWLGAAEQVAPSVPGGSPAGAMGATRGAPPILRNRFEFDLITVTGDLRADPTSIERLVRRGCQGFQVISTVSQGASTILILQRQLPMMPTQQPEESLRDFVAPPGLSDEGKRAVLAELATTLKSLPPNRFSVPLPAGVGSGNPPVSGSRQTGGGIEQVPAGDRK